MLKIRTVIVNILIALAAGGASAFLTRDSMAEYEAAVKPPLAPPSIVFPIVWAILFILMGVSAALIRDSGTKDRGGALAVYAAQLAVNFIWPIIFFGAGKYLLAFFWLLLLLALVIIMIVKFRKIRPLAGTLQIPYLLWLIFAGYLNFAVWLLNK